MLVSMAAGGYPVGFVGLDEQPWQYVVSALSVWTGRSRDWVEEVWDEPEGQKLRADWREFARGRVHIFGGRRPNIEHLNAGMEMAAMGNASAPRVLFVDYLDLLSRDKKYGYKQQDRLVMLVEEMKVWAVEAGVAVVVLHQLSRTDEYGGANNRNAGHIPATLTQMKYGGEEPADIVFGTYRPTMNPLAQMEAGVAKQVLGQAFDEDWFYEIRGIAAKTRESTFLQLLKNRPGTHREERGIELLSPYGDSLLMTEREGKDDVREAPVDGVRGGTNQ
jgi:hypothetical protein